jgi:serine/threonine protein kinase
MATVYVAVHRLIEKEVALKILSSQLAHDGELVDRFLLEARSASQINHENVIQVFDLGQSGDGYVYMAMELLWGSDLGDVLTREGALPCRRVREIAGQIGRALCAAHEKEIVHRDLKPENVFLVQKAAGSELVKLLDFGIAKVIREGGKRLTRTGAVVGTPEYMAPEQIEATAVDKRADVYAFGCVLYQMVTGKLPFPGESAVRVMMMKVSRSPQAPSAIRSDLAIPPRLDAIILRALEKDPASRWQRVSSMLHALDGCPDWGAAGRPSPPSAADSHPLAVSSPRFYRRPSVWVLALVVAFVGGGVCMQSSAPVPHQPNGAARDHLVRLMVQEYKIDSIPDGADVYIRGSNEYLGKTPFLKKFEWNEKRPLVLVFRLRGYEEQQKEVKPYWSGLVRLLPTTAPSFERQTSSK